MTTKTELAEAAYAANHAACMFLLSRIAGKVARHKPADGIKGDWSYVGDVGHVREMLTEIESFLSD